MRFARFATDMRVVYGGVEYGVEGDLDRSPRPHAHVRVCARACVRWLIGDRATVHGVALNPGEEKRSSVWLWLHDPRERIVLV